MLTSDLIALAVAIAGVGIACLFSRRVRMVVLDLFKGPTYVSASPPDELPGLAPIDPAPLSLWVGSIRTISAVATAIVVLQAGSSLISTELSIISRARSTTVPVSILSVDA